MMPTPAVAPTARSDSEAYGVVKYAGRNPGAAVAADEKRLGRGSRHGPVGDVDQGCPAVDLHHTGVLHGTRDGDERGPGVFDQAVGPECVRAGAGDHRHVGQRLRVVDEGAAAPYAQGRALVRAEGREGLAGLDPARQGRLLAGDEAVRRPHHRFGDGRTTGCGAFGERLRHRGGDLVAALGHAHRRALRAAGRGEELRAVEHQMGRPDEEELVLVAGRLALHGVHEDGAARPHRRAPRRA